MRSNSQEAEKAKGRAWSNPRTARPQNAVDLFVISLPATVLTNKPNPQIDTFASELALLKEQFRNFMMKDNSLSDSDFEHEVDTSCSSSSAKIHRVIEPLSQSTLSLIGEVLTRRSNSNK